MAVSRMAVRQASFLLGQGSRRAFATTLKRRAGDIRIVEVGPRDGLQTEAALPLKTKLELIRRLSQTGVRTIEAGSFVAPKWVPQMADSDTVLDYICSHPPPAPAPIAYNFLVPNMRGLDSFLGLFESEESIQDLKPGGFPTPANIAKLRRFDELASFKSTRNANEMPMENSQVAEPSSANTIPSMEISVFTAATDTFSKKNTNCTIKESLERCKSIIIRAKSVRIRVRGYVSVALGCPYEGPNVSPSRVAEITADLREMGADEVSIADTTGMGTAPRTQKLLKTLLEAGIPAHNLALHFHDTYGQALVNVMVGLEHGITTFDSSVGGLGGCPYARGATGNVATEDLVHCLHSLGATTGIDLDKMAEIGGWISKELGKTNDSRTGKAILARLST